MKLTLVNNASGQSAKKITKKLFTDLLKKLPKVLPGVEQTELELLLTSNEEIQALNKQYRGKDSPTDVLSFGLEDPTHLGQLVISVERAQQQADDLGQSLDEELRFLFTHGLLHLLGYDHEVPEDEAIMLEKAYKILGRKN